MAGTKAIDRAYVEHVAAIVREIVDHDFKDDPRDPMGNQRRASRSIGISQAQISDLYNLKPGKGVGLPTLLALRAYTRRTIDDLLGLPAIRLDPNAPSYATRLGSVDADIRNLLAEMLKAATKPHLTAEDLDAIRHAVRGESGVQKKARASSSPPPTRRRPKQ